MDRALAAWILTRLFMESPKALRDLGGYAALQNNSLSDTARVLADEVMLWCDIRGENKVPTQTPRTSLTALSPRSVPRRSKGTCLGPHTKGYGAGLWRPQAGTSESLTGMGTFGSGLGNSGPRWRIISPRIGMGGGSNRPAPRHKCPVC